MKKKILLFILLTTTIISFLFSQGTSSRLLVKKIAVADFNKLVIRSDVTILLVEDASDDSVRIEGTEKFVEKLMLICAGPELIIRSKSLKDQKKDGTIYVPVHSLRNMEINANAKVISGNTLKSPELNILINGDCTVDLILKGKLNIREAEGYDVAYRRVYETRQTPFVQNQNLNY